MIFRSDATTATCGRDGSNSTVTSGSSASEIPVEALGFKFLAAFLVVLGVGRVAHLLGEGERPHVMVDLPEVCHDDRSQGRSLVA